MRNTFTVILSAVLTLLVVGCAKRAATVTLSVSTKDTLTLYQLRPLQGVCSIQTDTIILVGDTVLTQQIETDGLSQYTIFGPSVEILSLLLGDGDVIELRYDADSTGRFLIDDRSSNAEAERLYNKLIADQDPYKYEWVRDYRTAPLDTIGQVMYRNFRALASEDLAPFEELLSRGLVSERFVEFVSINIDYFYALSMAKVIRADVLASLASKGTRARGLGYATLFDSLWIKYPLNKHSVRCSHARDFAMIYANCNKLVSDTNAVRPKLETKAQYLRWMEAQIKSLSQDPQIVEPLLAQFLWFEAINNKDFDPTVDSLIVDFNTQFKSNQYARYYDRFLREGQKYRDLMDKPFSDKVIFMADTAGITTLAQIFDKFKGKNLYVDFWFSSCSPCRAEFKHSASTHKFLTQNDITPLFISVDRAEVRQNWLDVIKYHNLEGVHICVNQQTFIDMSENYGINYFPRYMIVDTNGVIVEQKAKAPSSGEELQRQINEKLKK